VTSSAAPFLLGAIAVGAVVLVAPRLFARTAYALRLSRWLRDERRARDVDLARAAAYHERLPAAERSGALDDRTWADLDLDQVFLALDRTRSEPGRQYLYHRLRTPHASREPLERLERAANRFAADDETTRRARAALEQLDDPRAGHLVDLLFGDLPGRPRLWWLFPLLTLGAVACLAVFPVWPRAAVVWVGICVANVGVQIFYRPRVRRFVPALHELPALVRVAATLGELPIEELADERRTLRDGAASLGMLRRATWWLRFEPGQANELAASVYEYVNLLFLLDVNAFALATETIRASRHRLRDMFEAIGYADAAQSVAAWRSSLAQWTTPELTPPRKALHAEGLVHPLVTNAVPNALGLENASLLITGSNMSGKSTFVRALGVNAVLAQTVHTACARAWRAPLLCVRTSIGRADSVVEGKSYYLAEVEAVLALVRAKESGAQHLFLLDEIFRGTNTIERVAAGRAVLSYLDRGLDLVIVATHDVELLELLGDSYLTVHFREQLADGALTFDYRLRPGPSSTHNAIALLELMQYPKELVADALATADRQRGGSGSESD
jgi:hypothetical protein